MCSTIYKLYQFTECAYHNKLSYYNKGPILLLLHVQYHPVGSFDLITRSSSHQQKKERKNALILRIGVGPTWLGGVPELMQLHALQVLLSDGHGRTGATTSHPQRISTAAK